MKQLLQQASRALSVHDADTLERLAAEASCCTAIDCMDGVKASVEVLQRQVVAARSHLELRHRLLGLAGDQGQSWVR